MKLLSLKNRKTEKSDEEFSDIIKDIISNDTVKQMKNYRQHCDTSCYKHCMQVAYFTYVVCKKLKLDYVSATRAAMLHDLFLYDWHEKHRDDEFTGLHAFAHPKIALRNANKIFLLNDKEKDIILKHMWPVTLSLPRYIESYVLTFFDKQCAMSETLDVLRNRCFQRKVFRYAYVFFSIIIFRFY